MDRIFPFHVVNRGGPISELPRAERRFSISPINGRVSPIASMSCSDDQDHRLHRHQGRQDRSRAILRRRERGSTFTSMSVAKSFTSTLVGLAIADGKISSIDQPITDYIPELNGTGYDGVPIKSILQMSSGVKFSESYIAGRYSDMDIAFQRGMIDEDEPLNDFMKGLARARTAGFEICLQGRRYAGARMAGEARYRRNARRLSFGQDLAADGHGARRVLECRFSRSRRDGGRVHLPQRDTSRLSARFGLLFLNQWQMERQTNRSRRLGRASDRASKSAGARPAHLFKNYPLGYGYQWWTFPTDRAYVAQGIYFQFIYVNPKENLVIVKTSAFDRPWDGAFGGTNLRRILRRSRRSLTLAAELTLSDIEPCFSEGNVV